MEPAKKERFESAAVKQKSAMLTAQIVLPQLRITASLRLGFFEDGNAGIRSASYPLGVEEHFEGFEKYLLLPAKHLRRERRAHDKHHGQCRYVAHMSRPGVALPNAFEQ